MDITTLRKMRNSDFGKIAAEFEKGTTGGSGEKKSYADERMWKLDPDKAGNATATIRFLPRHTADELPWVKVWNHGFQGPTGKWYIENSLTTIAQNDPVSELNTRLWNSGLESDKDVARKQKRKLKYMANILVVSDPKHPENEGKVFIYQFGKKIFDKIMDKAKPTFEDEDPVNVFDLWEGADFKLRQRKVEGYPNYDQSVFMEPSAVADSDEEILEVVNKQYRLGEFLEPKNFKTYDELARKLNDVLNGQSAPTAAQQDADTDAYEAPVARQVVQEKRAPVKVSSAPVDDEDDDAMSFFKKIAQED
jgi:hypothetical protein